jgi:putative ABC transport system permease protein
MSVDAVVEDIQTTLIALVPAPGFDPIEPVVVEGRGAFRPHEAVVGPVTMRELGLAIGDEIDFQPLEFMGPPTSATIVGVGLLNDGFEAEVGEGVLVDGAWARSESPESNSQAIAIRLDPERSQETLAVIDARFDGLLAFPEPSSSVRHLVRVDDLPILLAGVVVVLAAASLLHAMWVAVRQRRFELGILKSIGFSRRQVWASIATQAALVASLALVVGIPLGLIGGGWVWRAIADAVGLAVGPVFVPWLVVLCAAGAFAVALLASIVPGWRAAGARPADALRTE